MTPPLEIADVFDGRNGGSGRTHRSSVYWSPATVHRNRFVSPVSCVRCACMARAASHRGPRVPRFHTAAALRGAVIAQCELEFAKSFGRPWTKGLRSRYRLDPLTQSDDDEAGRLLRELQQLLRQIATFRDTKRIQRAVVQGEAPLRTKLLFDWAARHPKLIAKYVAQWDHGSLKKRFPTPRQWLARRLRTGAPHFIDKLKPASELTARDLALVSLLVGNMPKLRANALTSGLTAAEVIDLETKYMRKYLP